MDNTKDYYALYLKYKAKYIALKTGGAEIVVKNLNRNGRKDTPVDFYKTQIGEIEKGGSYYDDLARTCRETKRSVCNEDEVIKTYEDSIFNDKEYTRIYNSYPANYANLIGKINKGAEVYIQFIRDQIKKNKDCLAKSMLGFGCDAKIETIYKENNYKLRSKLEEEARKFLSSQGFNIDSYHSFGSIIEKFDKYDKDPKLAIVNLPFDPTGMQKGELYGQIKFYYNIYMRNKYF
jgi:hypothetical protein